MIVSPLWRGKSYAVLGLARSGAATVRALLAGGARVVAWDSDESKRNQILTRGAGEGDREHSANGGGGATAVVASSPDPLRLAALATSPAEAGEDLSLADPLDLDLAQFDALIVSPGVPLNRHPIAAKARAAGIPIIGDIELFAQARSSLPAHKVIGITGTNGKSTTTALIHHILQSAGVPTLMGGNIGLPILEQQPLPAGGVYVLELSSYQIDLTFTLDCDVAVLLNVTPDHLDRYDGFEGYAASKFRLFEMQSKVHVGVIRRDDPIVSESATESIDGPGNWHLIGPGFAAHLQPGWPSLQGPHNAENAAAAFAVCYELGLETDVILAAMESFTGLPHRMERVGARNDVAFVNDSKATNPESTAPALAAFERIHWILGGQSKADDLDACTPSFGHVVKAYTIGDAAPKFAALLDGKLPVEQSGTLAAALKSAAAQAQPGDTVLLSPACASFDQFRDFEDRGDQFRRLVEALDSGNGA